ncbi:MAG: FAD-binding oxidoreductase, partial [Rhodospirillales bacterium]|nr:FAD-binding oxidoreductase [Rhodospirillales bacterium]
TPWFIRFLLAGRQRRVDEIADALLTVVSNIFEAYEPLVTDAGAKDMIQHQGRLFVYTSRRAFESGRYERNVRSSRGVEIEELDGDQTREIEPKLGPNVVHGAYQRINGHVVNPKRLVQVLAEHLVRSGGTLLREKVTGFETVTDGAPKVVTETASHTARLVVIAAGAWSRALAAQLGTEVPMQAERGYFMMLPDPGIRGPLQWNDKLLAICPMEHGLRVSSGAEFAPVDAPPDYDRALANLRQVDGLIPGLEMRELERGMGARPSMPDSMPVIGACPGHPKVLFAFGHGHIGLTLGAVTGKLIGELAAGRPTSIDITPFRPDRF